MIIETVMDDAVPAVADNRDSLQTALIEWAGMRGYKLPYDLFGAGDHGINPDVVLSFPALRLVFVGDAKPATDLPSGDSGRVFRNYIRRFAELLSLGHIDGGRLAIATNTQVSSATWQEFLRVAISSEIAGKKSAEAPTVKIHETDSAGAHAWIVFCKIY
jgi:hypothetical protein